MKGGTAVKSKENRYFLEVVEDAREHNTSLCRFRVEYGTVSRKANKKVRRERKRFCGKVRFRTRRQAYEALKDTFGTNILIQMGKTRVTAYDLVTRCGVCDGYHLRDSADYTEVALAA